jgi:transposase
VIHKGLLNIIRRMKLREISRHTGLSRNTIAKYLNAGTIEPTFTVPERPSKLDPFADKLAAWLKTGAGRSRKQRRTLKQLHADLVVLGFTGSYGRVAAFARDWRAEQQTAGRGIFVPLSFRPGEAFQFDWSEDYAVIGGERTKLQVAHIKLSHSRAFLVRAYLLQTHEMLFDAHWHGFRVFGGVPGRGIYDNMKTAVDRVGRGKEREVNIRLLAMTNHYVFAPEFCNRAAGWEKGQVEKVDRWGNVSKRALEPSAVNQIVKQRAALARAGAWGVFRARAAIRILDRGGEPRDPPARSDGAIAASLRAAGLELLQQRHQTNRQSGQTSALTVMPNAAWTGDCNTASCVLLKV